MGVISKTYLVLYNAACIAGWSYVLYEMAQHFLAASAAGPKADYWHAASTLYPRVEKPLKIVQTAAILEIVHAMVGLVRSPVVTTFMQVFSRLFILWGITHVSPASQNHWCFALMCASWASVEPPRYLYYLIKLIGNPPGFLTWIRYSLFIVLYPTGITGEVLSLWRSMPMVEKTKLFSYSLPNTWNFAFSYYYFQWFLLAFYVPGSYIMYSHMLRQRRKELGGGAAVATADKPKRS
jgi:very-long-chain (3R)-3-hydroxyacyl-CoA dehydratase